MWKDIDKYFKDQWNVLDALALMCLLIGLVIRGIDWTSPWGPAFYALSAPLIVGRVLFFAQVLRFQGPMIKVGFEEHRRAFRPESALLLLREIVPRLLCFRAILWILCEMISQG